MVLFSERRHRLHGHELDPVLKAVRNELIRLLEDRKDLFEATILFKVLFRFEENKQGRPIYPEPITWTLIEKRLDLGKGPLTLPMAEAIIAQEGAP